MQKGKLKNIRIPNKWNQYKTLEARYLGRGSFSICFESGGMVYSFVKHGIKETDYSKEIISEWVNKENPHIPEIQKIGNMESDNGIIYQCPLYKPLTSKNRIAWSQFKIVESIWNELRFSFSHRTTPAYIQNQNIIESVKNNASIPKSLIEALQDINDSAMNYGNHYYFEFAKRNLCVDEDGNLILLDVIFNKNALKWNQ